MSEGIYIEIGKAIQNHIQSSGQKAKQIYLGRNQIKELNHRANAHGETGKRAKRNQRTKVAGLLVFAVDDDDHIACL